MGEVKPGNSRPGEFKTRKRTAFDGLTLGVLVTCIGLIWTVFKDVKSFKTASDAASEKRHAETLAACYAATAKEEQRAKEEVAIIRSDVRDLKIKLLGGYR